MINEILITTISILLVSTILSVIMAWPMLLAARVGCDRKASLARAFLSFWVQTAGAHALVFLVNLIFWGPRPPVSNLPESWIGMTLALLLTGWFAYGKLLFPRGGSKCPVKGRIGLTVMGMVVVHIANAAMLYFFLLRASQA